MTNKVYYPEEELIYHETTLVTGSIYRKVGYPGSAETYMALNGCRMVNLSTGVVRDRQLCITVFVLKRVIIESP